MEQRSNENETWRSSSSHRLRIGDDDLYRLRVADEEAAPVEMFPSDEFQMHKSNTNKEDGLYEDSMERTGSSWSLSSSHQTSLSIDQNDTERAQQEKVLPSVWKRMPNTAWGICMGLAGNANMWNKASDANFISERINTAIPNYLFWAAAIVAASIVAAAYLYKLFFYPKHIKAEWACPERIHFMNGPHLTLLLLTLAVPNDIGVSAKVLRILWTICLFAQTTITQLIYEKWLFPKPMTPYRSYSNPQFLLSTIGWFLLSVLGQTAGIDEQWGLALPQFCLGAGAMLYLICVVSLLNDARLVKRSPVLFLLIAPPSVGVVALDLFDNDPNEFSLAASCTLGWCLLIVLLLIRLGPTIRARPPTLGAYWAYVFPLAALATAMLQYASVQQSVASQVMAVAFLCLAVFALVVVICRLATHSYLVTMGREEWQDPLLLTVLNGSNDSECKSTANEDLVDSV